MKQEQLQTINAIRVLSAEAIDKAKSGHPGLPLGCASIGYALFANELVHNPQNPGFFNRDRFILSAGHGSMLLYSLLHLFGYGLTKEDLMNFRQVDSLTPGHPEYGVTKGVETSTGPLGQGVANAVGFAIAESILAAKFNKPNLNLIDHYTYALCGDGCMMEGIESEAASLAGTLKLGKLIVLYDSNNITIEGDTAPVFSEDVAKRHEAQGWHVQKVADGEDVNAICKAIEKAKAVSDKPSLIVVKTVIGYGSSKAGSADCHGSPLGAVVTEELKGKLDWKCAPFEVPEIVKKHMAKLQNKFTKYEDDWNIIVAEYKNRYPQAYQEFCDWVCGETPSILTSDELWTRGTKDDATRNSSGLILNKLAQAIPNLFGGAADLAPSTKTNIKGGGDYGPDSRTGRNFHFGIREHAMSAIMNGMQLHGGLYVYASTFFIFSDYMKNGMRMSALMGLPVMYILTHDSIGVGEDGPTHEPIEQLAGLRAMPNMKVYRPADQMETIAAYVSAMTGHQPTCIVCSRQNLPQLEKSGKDALKGGYVVYGEENTDMIFIATGSEVGLAINAAKQLAEEGIKVRVVSMPCVEEFEKQSAEYKESILPNSIRKRIAIEAGATAMWYKYVGLDGDVIGIDTFGKSGPANELMKIFGFTTENVVNRAKALLNK